MCLKTKNALLAFICNHALDLQNYVTWHWFYIAEQSIGHVKFLISPTYSYGGATATRARVTHLPLMEHGVLMDKVVMKSVVIISI